MADGGQVLGSTLQGGMSGAAAGTGAGGPGWGTLIGGVLGAGAGLYSGLTGSDAQERAARQAAEAQQRALEYSQGIYDKTSAALQPYVQAGTDALGRANSLVANMQNPEFGYQQQPFDFDRYQDPSANYIMQRAQQALNASSIARGATGGGALQALQANAGNLANQAYNGSYNRWLDTSNMLNNQAQQKWNRDYSFMNDQIGQNASLAQQGLGAEGTLAGFGQGQSQLGAGLMSGIGSARAAGTLGASNSWTQGVGALANNLAKVAGYYGAPTAQQASYTPDQAANAWSAGSGDYSNPGF